jgi:hypothetical protein
MAWFILSAKKKKWTWLVSAENTLMAVVSRLIIWLRKTRLSEMQKFAFLTIINDYMPVFRSQRRTSPEKNPCDARHIHHHTFLSTDNPTIPAALTGSGCFTPNPDF